MSVPRPERDTDFPNRIYRPLFWGCLLIFAVLAGLGAWATLAPLATTVYVQGRLISISPSYQVQHPTGGLIKNLEVSLHQQVAEGQVLARLDTAALETELDSVSSQLKILNREKSALLRFLGQHDGFPAAMPDSKRQSPESRRLRVAHRALLLEHKAAQETARNTALQIAELRTGLDASSRQRASMRQRAQKQKQLADSGRLPARDQEQLEEAILDLEADISARQADAHRLAIASGQATASAAQRLLSFKSELLDRLAVIGREIPPLQTRRRQLQQQIEAAAIRAPADGTVKALNYATTQMYLPPGQTLLSLTVPAQSYQISFQVPPSAIDQLTVGMTGQVRFTSLPQRSLPRVQATILSLSPEASRNADGAVLAFDGLAELDPDGFQQLRAAIGPRVNMTLDMPLNAVFTGRETTALDYLAGPFFEFADRALQD